MPRVVPSQVRDFIDGLPTYQREDIVSMNMVGSPALSGVLDLVDQIPDELFTMDNVTYGRFILAKAEIKDILETWDANRHAGHSLVSKQFHVSGSPLTQMRSALAECPDESPAPSTTELKFITHTDLRTNLRDDIGVVSRALSNGEWKAATVLAGATIEALLLWDLQNKRAASVAAAVASLVTKNVFQKQLPPNLEDPPWSLHHYIEVSTEVKAIETETAKEARLAKGFRNLIHPGKSQRLGQKCDRGTAHTSMGALDHVVRDLSR